MDPQEFDRDLLVVLEKGNILFPTSHFSDKDDIIRAAKVSVSLAFGASALALDKAYEVAGIILDPDSGVNDLKIRTLVFMIRCAYAHGIAEAKWEVRNKFKRTISIEVHGETVEIDLRELNGKTFDYEHLGGYRMWFRILDKSISLLSALNANR